MADVKSYLKTFKEHQDELNLEGGYYNKGYLLTSLSVYRDNANVERYAAVWTNTRLNFHWFAFHHKSRQGYLDLLHKYHNKEKQYYPVIVTSTGGNILDDQKNSEIYAGVFWKRRPQDWSHILPKQGINSQEFFDTCDWAKKMAIIFLAVQSMGDLTDCMQVLG